jgi:hypothetical protein
LPEITRSQKRALQGHRRRQKERALARVEVQAPITDAPLLREVAATLRGEIRRASEVRARIRAALRPRGESLLDRLKCDLPDAVVDDVLSRPDDRGRAVEL